MRKIENYMDVESLELVASLGLRYYLVVDKDASSKDEGVWSTALGVMVDVDDEVKWPPQTIGSILKWSSEWVDYPDHPEMREKLLAFPWIAEDPPVRVKWDELDRQFAGRKTKGVIKNLMSGVVAIMRDSVKPNQQGETDDTESVD